MIPAFLKIRSCSFATLSIRDMERGEVRPLTRAELARLRTLAEGEKLPGKRRSFRYRKGYARPKKKASRRRKNVLGKSGPGVK